MLNNGDILMGNRDQLGKFVDGAKPGPGRPAGKTSQTKLSEAQSMALDNLLAAAATGNVDACRAVLEMKL